MQKRIMTPQMIIDRIHIQIWDIHSYNSNKKLKKINNITTNPTTTTTTAGSRIIIEMSIVYSKYNLLNATSGKYFNHIESTNLLVSKIKKLSR